MLFGEGGRKREKEIGEREREGREKDREGDKARERNRK